MNTVWQPHVTVAAVLEHDGKFLLVEEQAGDTLVLNQPAGHWEQHETLIDAVIRETLEETAYHFQPSALIGVYRWPHPHKDIVYLRFAFTGTITKHEPDRPLDQGIVRALWLSPAELHTQTSRHRSPLVNQCVQDFLANKRYPLDLLTHL